MPAVLFAGFGLLIGSFLNVLIFRLPAGRSIVSPPSACATCGSFIRRRDNIPVLSWILLRGRCRDCGAPISARYPLVELGTALLFGVVGVRFGGGLFEADAAAAWVLLLAFLYLASISVALAMIDIDTHTLPNRIVLPSYIVGGVLLGWSALLDGDLGAILRAVISLGAMWLAYLVLAMASRGGMGFGDVKLAGVLGLFLGFLGWGELAVGAFSAFILGGLFALGLVVTGRAGRKSGIPFGPWMLGGAWVGVLFGGTLWSGYLSLIGLP